MPRTQDFLSQRILSVYLNIKVIFLLEKTTSHKCLALPRHETFNSLFACQSEMLLSLHILLEFPFSISEMAGAIRFVRVFDNQ